MPRDNGVSIFLREAMSFVGGHQYGSKWSSFEK